MVTGRSSLEAPAKQQEAVVAGGTAAVAASLMQVLWAFPVPGASHLLGVLKFALPILVFIAAAVYLGGLRGLAVTWILLSLVLLAPVLADLRADRLGSPVSFLDPWGALRGTTFTDSLFPQAFFRAVSIAHGFTTWSCFALPAFCATWIFLSRNRHASPHWFPWIIVTWLLLLAIADHMDWTWGLTATSYQRKALVIGSRALFTALPLLGCCCIVRILFLVRRSDA